LSWFRQHFTWAFCAHILVPKITKLCFGFEIFGAKISAQTVRVKSLVKSTHWRFSPWQFSLLHCSFAFVPGRKETSSPLIKGSFIKLDEWKKWSRWLPKISTATKCRSQSYKRKLNFVQKKYASISWHYDTPS